MSASTLPPADPKFGDTFAGRLAQIDAELDAWHDKHPGVGVAGCWCCCVDGCDPSARLPAKIRNLQVEYWRLATQRLGGALDG